jgi:putative membrane protein
MTVDAPPQTAVRTVPALLGGAVVAQIAYPLVSGDARDVLTELIVVVVAVASLCHAAITRGRRVAAALAAVSVVGGFAVEVLGVHTGVPFGRYEYRDSLGASLFGVPVVIAFAWPMLAWPAALAARRLADSFAARIALGAWALTAWDVCLDPQMVAAGHWHWLDVSAHLPGVPAVPLTDYAGWFVVSALMSYVLQRVLTSSEEADRWPLAFYLWTWASSTLALAAFLDLAAAAAWGFVAMGTVALPLARSLSRSR